MSRQVIRRAPTGHRCGESHPNARLTREDVELMRELHEEHGMGSQLLSRKFECGRSTVIKVLRYRTWL